MGQAADAPLTVEGVHQSERLADFLSDKSIDAIVSSPYVRARQTIDPFVKRTNIPIQIDLRLSERVLSTRSLINWQDCLKQTFDDLDLVFEGGESSRTALARGVNVLRDIERSAAHRTAIVTHGNLLILLLRHFDARYGFDEWATLSNPDVFLVAMDGASATVKRVYPTKATTTPKEAFS